MKTPMIMVVEDEAIIAQDIAITLRGLGYGVPYIASNAGEAMRQIEKIRPDLVLMDIVMPGEQDGIEATQEIRNRFDVPVIYLTAYTDEVTLQRAKVTEPYGYILKPFDKRQLQTQIEMALYKHILEKKLKESEAWYSTTLRSIGDAVIATDDKGIIKFLNPVAEDLTGWKESEAFGRELIHVFNIIDEEARTPIENPVTEALREKAVFTLSNHAVLVSRDGVERYIKDSGAPIYDKEGNVAGAVLVFHDTTEERKAAERLRKSEEKFRNLVEQTNNWVWETDQDVAFTYVNPRVYDITGYEPAKILGKTIFDLMTPEEAERFAEAVSSSISEQKSFAGIEKNLIHKDGHTVVLESSGSPIFDSQGVFRGYCGIDRDVTDQKRMEEELLKIQKLESLGVLAGGIAHDFNNILTAILGNISLAKTYGNPEDKITKRLTEAENACLRAKGLTQQLLTFSKGGAPVKKVAYIRGLIKDSTSFALIGSNVRCEFSIAEDLWAVEIDEGQITQVIQNLVINAKEAMPEGGVIRIKAENVVVEAEYRTSLRQGRYVKVTTEDEGIGISEEDLPKIFDPYFTTKQKGNGLGLAIAYSVVQNHYGHIGVESEIGAGTRFYIYIPASQEQILMKGELKEPPVPGKGNILVMDDEAVVREVAGEILTHLGYRAEFAKDGDEVVEMYRNAQQSGRAFGAVIVDLTVPGAMGGKEAIEKLIEIDPEVKAIVSSGYSNDSIMSEFEKYGFKGVISKPYRIEELSKILNKVIHQ